MDVRELQPQEVIYHAPEGDKRAHLEFVYPNGMKITHCKPGKANMEVDSNERETRAPKPIPGYKGKGGIIGDFLSLCSDPRKAVSRHRIRRQHHEPSAISARLLIACSARSSGMPPNKRSPATRSESVHRPGPAPTLAIVNPCRH